jgi:hypothetical protein
MKPGEKRSILPKGIQRLFANRSNDRMDPPREQLTKLVATYGLDILDMTRTVESELHICCPHDADEVNGLVAALRHGVVHYLFVLAENGRLHSADLPAQIQRLNAESGLNASAAERAVQMWADIIRVIPVPGASGVPWRREPRSLHRTALLPFIPALTIGAAGALASMVPWILVVAETHGEHYLIPATMSALGTHALLNFAGAAGGFLGGAGGWMLGTPLSLAFVVTPSLDSIHRVSVAVIAAALGSFFGLWLGYHHIADIGAFLGPFIGAGGGAFLASVYTWD